MKKALVLTFSILLILSSCNKEEEGNPTPKKFTASKGFSVATVFIDFEKDADVGSVLVERREKGTQNWQQITGTGEPFFDRHGYGNEGMPPGKVFEYRIRNDWPDDAEYSAIEEGYAYDIIPVTEVEITLNKHSNFLRWNEGNNESFLNDVKIHFDVYRCEDSLGTYQKIVEVDHDRAFTDDFYNLPELQGKTFFYRIDTWFEPFNSIATGTIIGAHNQNGNPIINYTITDLGQAASSSTGFIQSLKTKKIDNTIYFGAIKDAGVNSIGKPSLYKLNGSLWQEVWTTLPDPDIGFTRTSFAVNSSKSYMAGLSDSLCVYEWNGTDWSANLTPDNLGAGPVNSPNSVSIEFFNNELYMAIKQVPDYNLQVLKWDGTSAWDTIGGDVNGIIAGNVHDPKIETIDGSLYLTYVEDDVLKIKHLDETTWETDLEWVQDHLAHIQLDRNGSDLYFSSNTLSTSFDGGVYRVTSTSSVENLIPVDAEWFTLGVFSFTIDTEGNIIVSSMKVESAEVHYPYINIYDGTEWKTISDDFSDGTEPTGLESIGTDIYYIYGDAASQGQGTDPTILQSKKYSK